MEDYTELNKQVLKEKKYPVIEELTRYMTFRDWQLHFSESLKSDFVFEFNDEFNKYCHQKYIEFVEEVKNVKKS